MPLIDLQCILRETVSAMYGDLVTRSTGQAVRCGVEQVLAEYDGEQVAVIDFTGVRLLDLSCADEIVAKLSSCRVQSDSRTASQGSANQ